MKRYCFLAIVSLAWMVIGLGAGAATETPPLEKAVFAGGCFWCMEEVFEAVPGVQSVVSGYTGGGQPNPTYEEVSAGTTGHAESVEIVFDPAVVSYEHLLDVFWHNVDPTTADRQFCDKGPQYRPAIFYRGDLQKNLAEESRDRIDGSKTFQGALRVEIVPASTFYAAEEYHQDFYKRNPIRYKFYKFNCGRAQRLEALWGPKAG